VVYPLTTEGERFPFANSEARGFQLGEPGDETDYFRAILEGVAFLERLCFVHLESLGAEVSGPVALTGGGATSPVWSQIRADVLELPVVIPRSSEGSVGMAILAHAGEGSVAEAAARMSGAVTRFEPGENRDRRLAENFDRLVTAFVERGYISAHLANRARMA
jgi:sugar (pentulose or hexulose) kinase